MDRRVKSLLFGGLIAVFFIVVLGFGIWLVVNSTRNLLASPRVGGLSEVVVSSAASGTTAAAVTTAPAPTAVLTAAVQTAAATRAEPSLVVRNPAAARGDGDAPASPDMAANAPSAEADADPAAYVPADENVTPEAAAEPADAENPADEVPAETAGIAEEPVEVVEEPVEIIEEEPAGFVPYQSTGDAELDGYCDEIIDSFYWDGMNDEQLAFEIWYYCIEMNYHNEEYRTDWINVAKETARWYSGNCFGHSSLARALLTRAGISNMQFWQPDGQHSWNMVNFGYGWYHFDTTDRRPNIIFMWTDAELDAYQAELTHPDHVNTYIPRPDGMPLTPEEPYDLSRVYP